MLLPGHFVHKANLFSRRLVGSAISIKHVGRFARIEITNRLVVQLLKDFRGRGFVDIVPVQVFRRFRSRIEDDPAILG